jgi:sucrose-6-phosphatase
MKRLLASDMDGTVIPLERPARWKKPIAEFRQAVETDRSIALAYVTGRHLELALQGVEKYALPNPRFIVCDVGTTVYLRRGRRWVRDSAYRDLMRQGFGGHAGADVRDALEGTEGLTLQEDETQAEFKCSYYTSLRIDRQKLFARVKRRLARAGIQANLVFSQDAKRKRGLLDVLPSDTAKDTAIFYLQRRLEIDREAVVYAGDSGNDLLAFVSGFRAIVVANTPRPVRETVRNVIRRKSCLADRIYFAKSKYTAGVLEGCRHFGMFAS